MTLFEQIIAIKQKGLSQRSISRQPNNYESIRQLIQVLKNVR